MACDGVSPSVRQLRAAARAGNEYFLRSFLEISEATGGRPLHAVVLLAMIDANVAHLDEPTSSVTAPAQGAPDDSLRRPVSISALAARLGLPYETARRTVLGLHDEGLCERRGRRYLVPDRTFERLRFQAALQANWYNLRRLVRRTEQQRLFHPD